MLMYSTCSPCPTIIIIILSVCVLVYKTCNYQMVGKLRYLGNSSGIWHMMRMIKAEYVKVPWYLAIVRCGYLNQLHIGVLDDYFVMIIIIEQSKCSNRRLLQLTGTQNLVSDRYEYLSQVQ